MRYCRIIGLVGVCLWLCGCVSAPPEVDHNARIAAATGLADPIELRVEGVVDEIAPAGETVLTLSVAIDLAMRSDPDIQKAIANVRIALADAKQERLLPNPIVSVAVRFPEGDGKSIVEAGLSAELMALLTRPARARAADARLRGASAQVLAAVLDSIVDVQERYASIQSIEAQLAALEQRREILQRLLDLTGARVQAGEASQIDSLALQTQRVDLDSEILELQSQRTDERLALARRIGRPSGDFEWQISAWSPIDPLDREEADLLRIASENRPEILAAQWELAALGDDAAAQQFAALDGGEAGVESEYDDGNWSIGPAVAIPIPLFDFGQARRERIEAQKIAARQELVQAQRQVIEEVRRAHHASIAADRAMRMLNDELLPLRIRLRDQTAAAYQAGSIDLTAALIAEQDLQEAQARSIELQHKATVARFQLERAVGGAGMLSKLQTDEGEPTP